MTFEQIEAALQVAEENDNEIEIVMVSGIRHIGLIVDIAWMRGVLRLNTGAGIETISLGGIAQVI